MKERKIIIGIICSTKFIEQTQVIWNTQLIESTSAKKLAIWIMEYYAKFGIAPGRDIESILYQKFSENKVSKDEAEDIEEILSGLSSEYEEGGINVDYLVSLATEYFREKGLLKYKENIETLVNSGKIEEAEKVASEYKVFFSDPKTDLNQFISSVLEIRKKKQTQPTLLLKPWLREGQTTIIYAGYGVGKSLLTIATAYILGLKDFDTDDSEISTWQVKNATGTLYIDGELGEVEMTERIAQFEWLGVQRSKYRMQILSIPEYQLATEDSFYLSNRINQLKIIQWLKTHPNYKLIVLDSASTLFGLVEENDNSEWSNKINPFLRDLRALNVACLMLHHAGKNSKSGLRGASAIGAMAHNIFTLHNHPSKTIEDGEAWFTVGKDKQRSSGFSFRDFSIRFFQENNGKETHWEITE